MKTYANKGGNSNVMSYEYGVDYITIQFGSGAPYTYSYASAGKENIEAMKRLADSGIGLNAFVKKNVDKKYVR